MASTKLPAVLRTQVEIAIACGVPQRTVAAALGVSRSTVRLWTRSRAREQAKKYNAAWQKRSRDECNANDKRWREANPEKARACARKNYLKQYERKPAYYVTKANVRRKRTKEWPCSRIEQLMIQYKYKEARRLTKETGIPHEVDHIWPLAKGGPHLPWNLQVLTAEENRKKADKV
jgi:5-methylcytosine-specific restriction endonuclease McrA